MQTLLTNYAITIVYLSFNGIYLVCLSVRKWLTDMTTFTRIDGYGVHPPPPDYLVVQSKNQNSNKLRTFFTFHPKMIAYFIISLIKKDESLRQLIEHIIKDYYTYCFM